MECDLPSEERDLLTQELLSDPTTRLFAATHEGITLDTWAAVKSAAYLAALVGDEPVPPTARKAEDEHTPAEIANAKKLLEENSIIAHLPVI